MKRKALIATLLFFAIGLRSIAENQKLVLWLRDGAKVEYMLKDNPVTTFDQEGNLVITTETLVAYWPHDKVLRFTYSGNESGIEDVNQDSRLMLVEEGRDMLLLSGLMAGTEIAVYTADGRLCKNLHADDAGNLSVDLLAEPAGLYIVRVDGVTYKIMKP